METNQNLAPVRQEWKPYASGSLSPIVQAQSTITIRQRSEDDIKEAIRYAMVLVGLRGANMPTDEEKFVLLNFIRVNFGNQTPEEIRLAFEYAIAGKFETDVKCYENFSCEYFARIMKAYIDYSRNEVKGLPKEIEPMKEVPSDQELKKQAIDIINGYADLIQKSKEESTKFTWITGGLSDLYKMLVKLKIENISKEEMLEIWRKSANIKNEDERWNWCRTQAYMMFTNQLADFGVRLDSEGKIKPITE
jgi:hypothetical protein